MDSSDADRQIKQMVNFILQEAHEKANEIRIKTEHDFNLEKQMLVHNAKIKIQEEYTRKNKEREISKRIARSSEVGNSRRQKMVARDELLNGLMDDAEASAGKITSDKKKYQELLKKLIIQSCVKIFESDVEIYCRKSDIPLVEAVIDDAAKEYVELFKKEANADVAVELTVNTIDERCLPESSTGGVVLTALNGKIVCDNTLRTRLAQVNYDLKPEIRNQLFPQN